MRALRSDPGSEPLDDRELEQLYDYPTDLRRPWIQVNFVSSADGAATVAGRSAGLSSPGDKRIFALGRDLCDVVLVGAATARVERYGGVRSGKRLAARRARLGLSEVPPIAVVTGRCSIAPDAPLFTDTEVAPIVLTCATAPAARREALAAAGADVVVAGADAVDLPTALDALAARGLLRVCCEGGPTLLGELIAADLVDQLCLTVSPLLAGGTAPRITTGTTPPTPTRLELASVLTEDDFLMLRYGRPTPCGGSSRPARS